MALESFYLCVSVAYLPFQIILLWYLSVTGDRTNVHCILVDGLGAGWQEKPAVSSAVLGGGGGGNLGVIMVRVCGPVF